MEGGSRELVKQVAAAVLLCTLTAHAESESASGRITVDGRQFALRYAYAAAQPGFFDRKTEDIRVLLTDVPLEDSARGDPFALARLARGGQLHGLEVVIDARGEPLTGFLFVEEFGGIVSLAGMHKFQPTAIERSRIAGRLFLSEPHTFDRVTFDYDITFAAAIARPPTAEEIAAALRGEPARAATAHLAAIQTGFDAFVATLTQSAAASYRSPGGLDRFNEIRADTPTGSRVVAVADGPDSTRVATVHAFRGDGVVLESFLTLRREGGAWKVER